MKIALFLYFVLGIAFATQYEVNITGPDLWTTIAAVGPGDEVIVRNGDYSTFSGGTYLRLLNLYGTSINPIVIRAFDGELVRITGDAAASQNVLNFNGQHFVFKGFEIVSGSYGIRLQNVSNAIFESLNIHDTKDNGVVAADNGIIYTNVTFRKIEISYTRGGNGNGFQLGGTSGCSFRFGLVDNNYVHHLLTVNGIGAGIGINVKNGSYGNVIRDNVIFETSFQGMLLADPNVYTYPNIIQASKLLLELFLETILLRILRLIPLQWLPVEEI